jgi:hypothetical protein
MSTKNEEEIIAAYENELANVRSQQAQNQSTYSSAMFGGGQKQNLIEFELDFSPELVAIERLLKCDVLVTDKNTQQQIWVTNPDATKIFLNDVGVNDVLRSIIIFVNKNKVLANYRADEITSRVRMISHEIRTLIYNNYEAYGIDNEYKMNNYSMMVLAVASVIEDVYKRSMGGQAHKSLSEQRIVTQNEPLMPQGFGMYPQMGMGGGQKKSGNKLWPWNWNRI